MSATAEVNTGPPEFELLEFAVAIGDAKLAGFELTMRWHGNPITPRQTDFLARCGINPATLKGKGHACHVIGRIAQRRAAGLATYKQVRRLRKFGVPAPHLISFNRASEILDHLFSERSSRGLDMLDLGPGYLPAFITEEVLPSAPIRPAEGVHDYLFTLARVLHPWRAEEQISNSLHDYARQCGRHVPESEITASIRRARLYAWNGQTHSDTGAFTPHPPVQVPKPHFDWKAFNRFIVGHDKIDADWLAARSPICPWNRTPASFLHLLYNKGDKVIIFDDFQSQGQDVWEHPGLPYDARALNSFAKGKRYGVWFLSCPVDGHYHLNDDGKQSREAIRVSPPGGSCCSRATAPTSPLPSGLRRLFCCPCPSFPSARPEAAWLTLWFASTPQAKMPGTVSRTKWSRPSRCSAPTPIS